jgi:hypothetical protein
MLCVQIKCSGGVLNIFPGTMVLVRLTRHPLATISKFPHFKAQCQETSDQTH